MSVGLTDNWERYQSGGDIYNSLVQLHSESVANEAALAAYNDDEESLLAILARVGRPDISPGTSVRDDSTLSIFGGQIVNDPLSAPLDGLNSQLGKAVWNVLKNPWVLLLIVGLVFYAIGGFGWVKRFIASK